jgi:hypothetical protein
MLLAFLALGVAPALPGSYAGGPDRSAAALARYELDPAIRAAIAARSVGLVAVPSSRGSYAGGPDRAEGAFARHELDPAVRTAIEARSAEMSAVSPVAVVVSTPDAGFAWGAAAVGLGAGMAAMCVLLACVTLVRNDGRLRSA